MKTTTSSGRFNVLLATAAFSVAATSFTVLCPAADVTDPPTQIVKYADLNLGTAQGANVLYSRIRGAAQNVCRPLDGRDPASQARKADCVRHAIGDAVSKVDEPALFRIYNANHSTPLPARLVTQSR